ncbi:MAG: ABC transporter ATP-binding protein [Peptococcaceae bacterium]|nr:ABC transporter ATP-binding protein [Peptococcaceae bacterium]
MNNETNKPALAVKNLTKSFGGVKAIHNVTISLAEGKSRVLIGPNGAGKTTLFNLITGEIPMDSGEICLFGENISQSSIQTRSNLGLARTYQISNLFKEMTVEENLFLSLAGGQWEDKDKKIVFLHNWKTYKKRVARINEVAESVALENKLRTTVSSLSHGEQRQLELGMALAPNPKVILFDEPLAGLSPQERKFMGELVRRLAQEKIALIIEHDMDFALSITENVTVLNHGVIVAEGSPQEIKNNPEVHKIYKLTGNQA